MSVTVETVPETGDRPLAPGVAERNRDPVGTGSTETGRVSKTGITARNRCQLHSVYNRPDGKQATFYFYLIQHGDKERGATATASNLQLIKILQVDRKTADWLPNHRPAPPPPGVSHFPEPSCDSVACHVTRRQPSQLPLALISIICVFFSRLSGVLTRATD